MDWFFLLVVILLTLLIPTAYAGKIGAPYAPTRRKSIRKVFKALGVGAGDVVVDLGAGDGSVVIEAARMGARAYGYELSPILLFVSWFRAAFEPRASIRAGNFYKQDISDATIVFVFLLPAAMPRLKKYLTSQSVPGAKYLIAYAFPLTDIAPLKTIKESRVLPMYVYNLRELTAKLSAPGKD